MLHEGEKMSKNFIKADSNRNTRFISQTAKVYFIFLNNRSGRIVNRRLLFCFV